MRKAENNSVTLAQFLTEYPQFLTEFPKFCLKVPKASQNFARLVRALAAFLRISCVWITLELGQFLEIRAEILSAPLNLEVPLRLWKVVSSRIFR